MDIDGLTPAKVKICFVSLQARSRGRDGEGSSPPEIFRLELNSATKLEFFY